MTAVIRENLSEVLHSVDLPSWPCFMTDVHPEGMLGLPDMAVAFLTKPNPTKNVSYSLATQNSFNHNAAEHLSIIEKHLVLVISGEVSAMSS